MMELGSIHPDEQSARRAVAMLLRAGIEPERVKLIRPRVSLPHPEASSEGRSWGWQLRARDVAAGVGFGMLVGALACVALTLLHARLVVTDPLAAYAWIVGTAMVVGATVTLLVHWRYQDAAPAAQPRTRRSARGWAVIVHARDVDQRALAARALARAAQRGHAAA
jgi:hypothetical protein